MKRVINLFLMSLAVLLALAGGAAAFAQGTTTEVTLLIGWGAILVLAGLTSRAILMRRGAFQ
ncbi:MAG TPA: hypothetical protein VF707_03450 [Ardenticatenaceae bacterium]|jgi:ABC-type nitrate/sulfonate/bicarbonate transport system substrate-binding protein